MPLQAHRRFPARQILRRLSGPTFGLVLALLAFALAALPLSAQPEPLVGLTLPQARLLARQALDNGDPGLAVRIGKGLLKADPKDPLAYYIIASGYAQLNDPVLARRAAGYAYRFSPPGPNRFEAAQLAARMAFDSGHYSLSQLWLRRTAIHAERDADVDRIARDYKLLRRINPWSLRLRADLRPSDNVNNGSDTSLNIIDGVPDGGTISASARALSGTIASLDVAPAYRLTAGARSATFLAARLYVERVALSESAKALAPRATGSDFASTYGELSLSHAIALGAPDSGGSLRFGLALGESWYGGERSYRFARLEAERGWRLAGGADLVLRAAVETRDKARFRSDDADILGFGLAYGRTLPNGDEIDLTIALRDARAASVNGTYDSASMRLAYAPDQRVGPARLAIGLVVGTTRYDTFIASLFRPPTQRTDTSLYGDVTLVFDRFDYAGFVPTLRLRTGQKTSNFSRFESRELSLSLGIGSRF